MSELEWVGWGGMAEVGWPRWDGWGRMAGVALLAGKRGVDV